MSDTKDKETKKTLSLGGTLSLKGGSKPSSVQNISQGRGKTVAVEVRRKRSAAPTTPSPTPATGDDNKQQPQQGELHQLTSEEREARMRALQEAEKEAQRKKEEAKNAPPKEVEEQSAAEKKAQEEEDLRQKELEELKKIEEEEQRIKAEQALAQQAEGGPHRQEAPHANKGKKDIFAADEKEEETYRARLKRQAPRSPARTGGNKRRGGKLTVTQVLNEDYERDRGPSLAAQRRAREKARLAAMESGDMQKIVREVVVPETITVQELANRMAERGADVIKELMKMGVMATINETIDADTAELLVEEFGHKIKRVTDADIESGIESEDEDNPADMQPRPPVVTIMGHVDHGKTSLLDALRSTDVVAGEAGGITQHIGAYQITMPTGAKITFLDTPGHAAFTEMRSRGANVTDIVVLVVAANDSIMPQTVEAINHAKAADVPIIVAINKVDLPDANPQKVKQDLLQHEVIVEELSGDTPAVEISAKKRMNLDELEEIILLQAELLELKANPKRSAVGTVVESKLEQGRGHVATVLVQKGTLRIGDLFVVGSEWGKVRALVDDHGNNVQEAIPGEPVEVLGLNGAPEAGDRLVVVAEESKARGISEYRQRKKREAAGVKSAAVRSSGNFEQMLAASREGSMQTLSVVIKGDVHGSIEAIEGSLRKIEEENEDVRIRVLHAGTGGITESDVTLANASNGMIIGFNVRANNQAREMAEREGTEIRYYNVIYNVIDDVKAVLTGLLAPKIREEYLGQALIKQVFRITKVGNVAGCVVSRGNVKRGAKVRLLRDDVVIHEGTLKTLKRHQDEVKEVKEGMECGMAFENYEDIKDGDIIECYEVIEEARTVD